MQIKSGRFKQHELSQQLKAHCTLKMYQSIRSEESNEDDFVAWLSRVLQENQPFSKFESNIDFVP